MSVQLTLAGVRLQDQATFSSFYPGSNAKLVDYLQGFALGELDQFIYIWGNKGSGCSHLLQSCCHHADQAGYPAFYLPLEDLDQLSPQLLDDLEMFSLICIDEIQTIAHNAEWEEAMFHLYNRTRDNNHRLLVAGNCLPKDLPIDLADLKSRLSWGAAFKLQELTDDEKIAALGQRAHQSGFNLSQEVARYLLRNCPRNTGQLFDILEELDQASLTAQRTLTIPFVKSVLSKSRIC